MRTNGHDGERFTARFTSEDSMNDEKRDDGGTKPEREVVPVSKAPKSRAKRPSNTPRPPTVSAAPAPAPAPSKPARKTPTPQAPQNAQKKGKVASPAPSAPATSSKAGRSRRSSLPPESRPAPLSLDPKKTLIDHPGQKSAATAARAATKNHLIEREDEISIPPSSDDLDDHDERFFAEGEAAASMHDPVRIVSGRVSSSYEDLRVPTVVVPPERRKKLTNYVKVAVALCGVLCLAALVRVGFSKMSHPVAEGSAAAAQAVPVAAPPVAPVAAEPPPVETPAAVEPAPAGAASTDAVPAAKTAREEKEDARKLLERGKLKDAIASAERSVAVDPTDAEAWLLLGAAHQTAGHGKDSRAAFVECTKQAKTGPIVECRAMLR